MENDKLLPSSSGPGGARGRGILPSFRTDSSNSRSSPPRLPRRGSGASISSSGSGKRPARLLSRQEEGLSYSSIRAASEVATAISRDLVGKAERWKLLAREPMTGSPAPCDYLGRSQLPEIEPLLAHDVDKHEVASIYAKDALAGRESPACIHDQSSLRALKLVRNKAWNQLLNVCTIFHLILPMAEVQRCLPCMGMQVLPPSLNSNSLHTGWRPTLLGSMWIECLLCLLYAYDLYQVTLSSSNTVHERIDASVRGGDASSRGQVSVRVAPVAKLPAWQRARTCMVAFLGVGLLTNIVAHYIFGVTWHRWSRVCLPFLFISRRTYLKHFVGGMIRVLPRMLPVAFLMSFVVFFYAFLGYIVYRHEPRDTSLLGDLDLFSYPTSSALTFVRMFTSIPFMLDVEKIYGGRKGIQVLGLSFGVIMVIFLGALVPAVANRNFQYQSKESYTWVKEQRKLSLTRAYMLLKRGDGTVGRDDWVKLMACLRPDCDAMHTSALFDAAKKAEKGHGGGRKSLLVPKVEGEEGGEEADGLDRLSKGGFFMLCALGTANFSQAQKRPETPPSMGWFAGTWKRVRQRLDAALSWSTPGSNFPVSRQVHNLALLVQGYQIVREGDDPEGRPAWAYPLGEFLMAYFCVQASLLMIVEGPRSYFKKWRYVLGMVLNVIGVAFYVGLWFEGSAWRSFYHILQASRIVVLWNVLHLLGSTSSEVATRLEFVFPAVLRSSFVLFSVTYSYAVLAYAMYCSTPLGTSPIDDVADRTMMQRWAFYDEVISFASLHQSFASMTDVIMLSNWPLFMDAAADAGSGVTARIFFYSFKGLTFYFVMPVMLGFIVQSYMAASIPSAAAPRKKPSSPPAPGGLVDALSLSRKPHDDAGAGGGGDSLSSSRRSNGDWGAGAVPVGGGGAGAGTGGGVGEPVYRGGRISFSDGAEGPTAAGGAGGAEGAGAGGRGLRGLFRGSKSGKAAAAKNGTVSKDGASLSALSTLSDRVEKETDRLAFVDEKVETGGGGHDLDQDDSFSSSDDDTTAPVVVTSQARSMSQTFWGAEQAKDQEAGGSTEASTEMQKNLTRLEAENASLRALVDSMQMDLQMANTRLYEEMQTPSRDRSPSPGRTPSRRADAAGPGGKPMSFMSPESMAPLRKRVGSASSVGGMEAIVETEDEEVGFA
ncbi:unnamed protein product [Pylaiella littoralis]